MQGKWIGLIKRRLCLALIALCFPAAPLRAQTSQEPAQGTTSAKKSGSSDGSEQNDSPGRSEGLQPGEDPENRLLTPFLKHIVSDQEQFWTEPVRFRVKDLKWALPAVGVTAGFIASDQWWSKQVPDKPNQLTRSKNISDYSVYSMIGVGGGAFLLGQITNDEHMKEAGLLSAEAAINATGDTYIFKEITQRQRPMDGNGNGNFFTSGGSFPSEHSAIAWSIASVMAHEYPGTLTQIAAYGLATAVSVTRVTAKQHFPSDVIVGSALGWYFGRQVYRAHHDPELGGSGWPGWFDEHGEKAARNPNYMASPYVPVDSWIYPAFERLIALGYAQSNMVGIRPWTRMACAQLLEDAQDRIAEDENAPGDAEKLYKALRDEFDAESWRLDGAANVGVKLESIYTRSTGISGTPLRDSFNFGETLANDYGRPYWTGYSNVTGITAQADAGILAFNLQAEYQHAPAMPSYSAPTLAAVAAANFRPVMANGTLQIDQVKLLNSTVSLNINNVQFTFGEQSAWLGPAHSGSFLMGNNAPPIPMLRIDDVQPHDIPGLSRILGPFRTEFFVGQLSGHHWEFCLVATCMSNPNYPDVVGPNISPQPFIHGEKISFQPTPNLEIGMGVTAMFGGPGLPVTFGNFFRTYFAHSSTAANNPGKRISQVDFTYRVPGLRNWLTIYLDSLVVDEPSPVGSTRASINPGIYMPRLPRLPKIEFRAEGINQPRTKEFTPGFVYYDGRRYRDGYTNDGVLMGNPIGRAGRGVQSWLSYSFNPRNRIELQYRLQTVSRDLVQGGRLSDYSVRSEFMLGTKVSVSGLVEYEPWRFLAIAPGHQSDTTVALQMTFFPHWQAR